LLVVPHFFDTIEIRLDGFLYRMYSTIIELPHMKYSLARSMLKFFGAASYALFGYFPPRKVMRNGKQAP
jgi:hypothetical protein